MRSSLNIWPLRYKVLLLLLDVFALIGSFYLAFYLRLNESPRLLISAPGFWFSIGVALINLYIFGNYDFNSEIKYRFVAFRAFCSSFFTSLIIILTLFLLAKDTTGLFGRGVLLGGVLISAIFLTLIRFPVLALLRETLGHRRYLVIAPEEERELIKSLITRHVATGDIVFVNDQTELSRLLELIRKRWVGVILSDNVNKRDFENALLAAGMLKKRILTLSQFYQYQWRKVPLQFFNLSEFIRNDGSMNFSRKVILKIKRISDFAAALILLICLSPLLLFTYLVIVLESSGGALFRQVRVGQNGKNFTLIKFRTMRSDAEADGPQWASAQDARVTRVGRFLRKTRIDELPQLINVLKGDMSLIGPRPERPEFVENLAKEIPYYRLRHLMPPGLSGWAQINYPYGASIEDSKEKLEYELYYIKNYSLVLDMKIALRTLAVIIFQKGR